MAHKTLFLIIAMAGLAIGALVPPFLFRDRGTDLPPIVLQQLKTEASCGYTLPPGIMQVIDVRAHGEYPYRVEGTVIYRSLFGLSVASARYYNSATVYELAAGKLWGLWAGFILAEGALGLLLRNRPEAIGGTDGRGGAGTPPAAPARSPAYPVRQAPP